MSKVVIPKNIDHDVIEELLISIESRKENHLDLQIPEEVIYRGFGILTGLWSVVFKWMRIKSGAIIVALDKDNAERVEKFVSGYFAYVILSTVWTTSKIVDDKGEDLKKVFREYTAK